MHIQTIILVSLALVACSEDKGGGNPAVDAALADAALMDAAPQPMDAAPQPMDAAPMDAAPMDAAPESMDAAPPAECEDLSGMYYWEGPCVDGAGTTADFPFTVWTCFRQTECVLSDATESFPVVGDEASLDFSLGEATCELRFADGDSNVACDVPNGGDPLMCTAAQQRFTEPDAVSYCCDVMQQDCGAGLRCQIFNAVGNLRYTACVPVPAQPVAEGETCIRVDGRLGGDNCETGTFCANFNQPTPGDRRCFPYCQSETDCAAGEICHAFSDSPVGGACRPSCTIGGDECPAGLTCRAIYAHDSQVGLYAIRPVCEWTGAVAEGEVCAAITDCGAHLTCADRDGNGDARCRPICDATHPCAPGSSCLPIVGLEAEFGGANPQGYGACHVDE